MNAMSEYSLGDACYQHYVTLTSGVTYSEYSLTAFIILPINTNESTVLSEIITSGAHSCFS